MKVWLVVIEQIDEHGNGCNHIISGVYSTYIKAKEKQRYYSKYYKKLDRKITYIGEDTVVFVSAYGAWSVVYIEEREVK